MLARLSAVLLMKKKDFATIGGAIKMMEDLTFEERLRERGTLHLGENHPRGALHMCLLENIVSGCR